MIQKLLFQLGIVSLSELWDKLFRGDNFCKQQGFRDIAFPVLFFRNAHKGRVNLGLGTETTLSLAWFICYFRKDLFFLTVFYLELPQQKQSLQDDHVKSQYAVFWVSCWESRSNFFDIVFFLQRINIDIHFCLFEIFLSLKFLLPGVSIVVIERLVWIFARFFLGS